MSQEKERLNQATQLSVYETMHGFVPKKKNQIHQQHVVDVAFWLKKKENEKNKSHKLSNQLSLDRLGMQILKPMVVL